MTVDQVLFQKIAKNLKDRQLNKRELKVFMAEKPSKLPGRKK